METNACFLKFPDLVQMFPNYLQRIENYIIEVHNKYHGQTLRFLAYQ